MILTTVFIVSGACILLLLLAKMWEMKHKKPFFLLGFISNGDHHIRNWSQVSVHAYSELKEDASFFVKKQIPLHSKNILNKTEVLIKEKTEKLMGDMRNARLLKSKNEGISEFFKNVSEMEKENAEESSTKSEEEVQ
jgi:hypothetical protein